MQNEDYHKPSYEGLVENYIVVPKDQELDIDALTMTLSRAQAITELLGCYHEDEGNHAYTLDKHTLSYACGTVESLLEQASFIVSGKQPTVKGVQLISKKEV